ncbi:radical SAM protein [Carnobacterium maltaromaticum]|uniref:Radical SAM protein n=1 Tax=Carnobacterium maltaromaticum TaxID=2751 RepID=A0AAW9JV17_CARML|nr:radical SAM protein [Carnobacterium maltaromaticum]MDZ5757485.1 radical SAM protein [Carnobacterium maltaromaticum]
MLSKYNHYKKSGDDVFIYNSISDKYEKISNIEFTYLNDKKMIHKISNTNFSNLIKKDMLINDQSVEFSKIMLRYNEAVYSKNLHIVLLASTDCNLECSYCYQELEKMTISDEFIKVFIEFIKRNIRSYEGVYIEWFGGEPLLARRRIIELSTKIKNICKNNNIPYIATMTTNGYYLNDKVALDLINSGIKFFQVTLDGNEDEHNLLRVSKNGKGSYKKITENLIKIKTNIPKNIFFRIGVRNNVSKRNIQKSAYDFFEKYLVDDPRFSYFQYPIKNWGGTKINKMKNDLIGEKEELIDTDKNSQFSRPLSRRLCYATKNQGYSITPDLKVYKCHHFIGKYFIDKLNIMNYVGTIADNGVLYTNEGTSIDWNVANINEKCKTCKYLPNCLFDKCPLKMTNDFENCRDEQKLVIKRKMSVLE